MGPRMNRPTCVDFHSFKVSLAVGFSDNTVSVFTINKTNGFQKHKMTKKNTNLLLIVVNIKKNSYFKRRENGK